MDPDVPLSRMHVPHESEDDLQSHYSCHFGPMSVAPPASREQNGSSTGSPALLGNILADGDESDFEERLTRMLRTTTHGLFIDAPLRMIRRLLLSSQSKVNGYCNTLLYLYISASL